MKLNKKGFVLAETLVVAVFMAAIFTIIYVNFYPLIGEYEKRENYDDLDSKYDIYWFKRLVQNRQALPTGTWQNYTGQEYKADCDTIDHNGYCDGETAQLKSNQYVKLIGGGNDCNMFSTTNINGVNYKQMCQDLKNNTGIQQLYLTTYYLNATTQQEKIYENESAYFKDKSNGFDENIKDYISYLPDFKFASPNGARFRLIAQFKRRDPGTGAEYYTYATIEVNREKGV